MVRHSLTIAERLLWLPEQIPEVSKGKVAIGHVMSLKRMYQRLRYERWFLSAVYRSRPISRTPFVRLDALCIVEATM